MPVLLTRNVTTLANLLEGVRGALLDVYAEDDATGNSVADCLFGDARVLDLLLRVPEVVSYRLGLLVRLTGKATAAAVLLSFPQLLLYQAVVVQNAWVELRQNFRGNPARLVAANPHMLATDLRSLRGLVAGAFR